MKSTTLIKVATTSILKHRLRSTLTMLGIIIGVSAVIVMVAIGQGAQTQIRERIDNLGTNMIVITPGTSSQGGISRGAGSFNRLTVDDAEALATGSVFLSAASPVIVAPSQVIGGTGNWRTMVNGVSPDYQVIRNWSTESGQFFDDSDVRSIRKVVVIGQTVAEHLFPDSDPVGQNINHALMRCLVRKSNHLIFNRRTITRTCTFNIAIVHRRTIKTLTNNIVGLLIGISDMARHLLRMFIRLSHI